MKGDHLTVSRRYFTHHGIDLGDGRVVHYDGEPGDTKNAAIRVVSREIFAAGGKIRARRYPKNAALSLDETIRRALSRVGERGYDLLISNCEHFASWCKTGEARSKQVENPKRTIKLATMRLINDVAECFGKAARLLGGDAPCEPKRLKSSRRSS